MMAIEFGSNVLNTIVASAFVHFDRNIARGLSENGEITVIALMMPGFNEAFISGWRMRRSHQIIKQ